MRAFTSALLQGMLVCVLCNAASARQLAQAATPSYPSLADAVAAAAPSSVSTLIAAVKAAGVADSLTSNTSWTILTPTNDAFTDRLKRDLNITPEQLLQPENKETLIKVLSYHVIPSGAVLSSQLVDDQTVQTALAGAAPLKVDKEDGRVEFEGANNSADVTISDIKAGNSVVHVINDVLLPAGIGKGGDEDDHDGEPASSGK